MQHVTPNITIVFFPAPSMSEKLWRTGKGKIEKLLLSFFFFESLLFGEGKTEMGMVINTDFLLRGLHGGFL